MATAAEEQNVMLELDKLMSYRDGYKNLFRISLLLVLVAIGLMCTLYYRVAYIKPEDRYFATTAAGQRMQMVALSEPYISNALLLDWAAQAATSILTFGFDDINERFALSRQYFSPEGWESFRASMASGRTIQTVRQYQQVITAIPSAPPTILAYGRNQGKLGWMVEVPLVLTIRVAGQERVTRIYARMFVVRLPTTVNPAGIGIFTWTV